MTPTFEEVQKLLKELPGLGYRSAERLALSLLIERPERLQPLVQTLSKAAEVLKRCTHCGNISEDESCMICLDSSREQTTLCIVEQIPDLHALERSHAFRGLYHILHGKLSPIHGVGPEHLNFETLDKRLSSGTFTEIILGLSNDVEGEATCHYIQETLLKNKPHIQVTRIGFGIPSGGGLLYADSATLKSALAGRQKLLAYTNNL